MSRNRFMIVIAAVVAAALSAGLFLGRSGRSGTAAGPAAAAEAPSSAARSEPQIAAQPEPQPQPQPTPNPGVLAVGPSLVDLAEGQWTAQFTVGNIGGSDLTWFAVGVPSAVSLSAIKGTLAPGDETIVLATVDHTKLAKGPFSLTLHVSANDTAQAVTINGTKQVKVVGPVGPGVLSAK